jgi:abhydrolase domain-containing protein 5
VPVVKKVLEDNYDEAAFLEAEKKVLLHSGLSWDQFKVYNVKIDEDGNFIRTIEVGDSSKPKIVLIHGYGGSSVKFWKIIKPLIENYHLIMIDIIGMGASSRPRFNLSDPNKIDEYLVEWLEKWRIKMGLEDFVLAGHSFGGYVSGLYATKHH